MSQHALILTAAAALLGLSSATAQAQAEPYPSKPVRIVVPFVPGGPVDVMARMLSEQLSKSMKATVMVENRPGAGGNIGSSQVAKAPADGYTLLLTTGSILSINEFLYTKLNFDPSRDFAPISLVGDMPLIVTVNTEVPAQDLKGLIAWSKEHQQALKLSSPGNGTTPHLASELFKRETGVAVLHIPYKGGAESASAILAHQVDGGIETPPSVLPHIQSGKMRALAIAGPDRLNSLPDVPTTSEAGMPELQITTWFGLVAPAKTPEPLVNKLNAEVVKALKDPGVQARFTKLAIRPASSTPQQLAQLSQNERAKWGVVVKETNIRLD